MAIVISCNGQTTKCLYETNEVDSIIADLVNKNTKLQMQLEALQASSSFIKFSDTAYIYIADTVGNYLEVRKNGGKMSTIIAKDSLRISSYFGDDRSVYMMNDTATKFSILEQNDGYTIKFNK